MYKVKDVVVLALKNDVRGFTFLEVSKRSFLSFSHH